jgi:hypothetical protein
MKNEKELFSKNVIFENPNLRPTAPKNKANKASKGISRYLIGVFLLLGPEERMQSAAQTCSSAAQLMLRSPTSTTSAHISL